jgi:hypothetical protein
MIWNDERDNKKRNTEMSKEDWITGSGGGAIMPSGWKLGTVVMETRCLVAD